MFNSLSVLCFLCFVIVVVLMLFLGCVWLLVDLLLRVNNFLMIIYAELRIHHGIQNDLSVL